MVMPMVEMRAIPQEFYPNPMPVVILAGGKGSRIAEVGEGLPKPLMKIGDKPLLGHIIDIYAGYGFKEFIIAGGYKVEKIAEYLFSFGETTHEPNTWQSNARGLQIHLEDTGLETKTGGRLWKLRKLLRNRPFMVTYGDGLSDVRIDSLIHHHRQAGRAATVTAVHPKPRFGAMSIGNTDRVLSFSEKNDYLDGWINGGFFVFHPDVLLLINGDETSLEYDVLPKLVLMEQLTAYRHTGFWECVDTLRDLDYLNEYYKREGPVWISGKTVL